MVFVATRACSEHCRDAADPRGDRLAYIGRVASTRMRPWHAHAAFVIDAHWTAPRPPRMILLRENCAGLSKASLLARLGPVFEAVLADVQLSRTSALLVFRDENLSLAAIKNSELSQYAPVFDADGTNFDRIVQEELDALSRAAPVNPQIVNPVLTQRDALLKPLSCSRSVPCILVRNSGLSASDIRRAFRAVVHAEDIHSIERDEGNGSWHVHLQSTSDVHHAKRHAHRLYFEGVRLSIDVDDSRNPLPKPSPRPDGRESSHGSSPPAQPTFRLPSFLLPDKQPQAKEAVRAHSPREGENAREPECHPVELPEFRRRNPIPMRSLTALLSDDSQAAFTSGAASKISSPAKDSLSSSPARHDRRGSRGERRAIEPLTPVEDAPPAVSERINASGCARTEGIFRLSPGERASVVYVPPIEALLDGTPGAPAAQDTDAGEHTAKRRRRTMYTQRGDAPDSARLAELALGRAQSTISARSRRLALGRSGIHAWGLYAAEDIEAGALVIEYLGEVIRASLADARERRMELAAGEPVLSSYLFRLDLSSILDATRCGGIARFINHSCKPSCVARTVPSDGALRIALYARRDIRRGEEITYDYKFPLEADASRRVRCLCGTRTCRGYLN